MTEELRNVEVFRAGRHTDSAGRARDFGEAEIGRLVDSYDPAKHEAPLVVGHPEHNAPAYGWVRRLKRKGALVLADFSDVSPEFMALLRQGAFKKRSISLYPDGGLRHVGFLGAAAPAVKGLRDVSFSEPGESTFEFGEVQGLAGIATRLRGWLEDRFGPDEAEKVVSAEELEALNRAPADEISAEASPAPENQEKDELSRLREENASLAARLAELESSRQREEIASFCESLSQDGKLTPYQSELAKSFLHRLDSLNIEFSESGQSVEKPGGAAFREFLSSLPRQLDFSETATASRAAAKPIEDPAELAKRISEYMETQRQSGRDVGYAEAALHLAKQ